MSATISDKVMMKEVLKATGFDCPQGAEFKDRGQVYAPLNCFLVVGTLN